MSFVYQTHNKCKNNRNKKNINNKKVGGRRVVVVVVVVWCNGGAEGSTLYEGG
jgi:hypothetical protein